MSGSWGSLPRLLQWRYRRMNEPPPFGKPFKYTDTLPTLGEQKKSWWRRLFSGKKPVAWLVEDDPGCSTRVVAETLPVIGGDKGDFDGKVPYDNYRGEIRISPIEPAKLIPVYSKNVVDSLILSTEEKP